MSELAETRNHTRTQKDRMSAGELAQMLAYVGGQYPTQFVNTFSMTYDPVTNTTEVTMVTIGEKYPGQAEGAPRT